MYFMLRLLYIVFLCFIICQYIEMQVSFCVDFVLNELAKITFDSEVYL